MRPPPKDEDRAPEQQSVGPEEEAKSLRIQPPRDIKVRRGLGILEELIKEKSPNYFKELMARKQAQKPLGLRVSAIAKRLAP